MALFGAFGGEDAGVVSGRRVEVGQLEVDADGVARADVHAAECGVGCGGPPMAVSTVVWRRG